MDTRQLLKTDLNLLVALQVLLEERSVSRAADRMFITQPAMSKTLARLRTLLDDPLFTRTARGMTPTPRALELREELQQVLGRIQHLVAAHSFDPAVSEREFVVATTEFLSLGFLPPLMARLSREAPSVSVRSITRIEHQLDRLASGEIDFAAHVEYADYGPDFIVHSLGSSPPVILCREGHPLLSVSVDIDTLAEFPQIGLYVPDLEELEIARNVADFPLPAPGFETSHLMTALEVLRQSDYIMVAPPFIVRDPIIGQGIRGFPIPNLGHMQVRYMLARHKRTINSPAHNWFWDLMLEVIAARSTRN